MEVDKEAQPAQAPAERSPRTHVDSQPLPTDSMVTVPLSETDGGHAEEDDTTATLPQLEIPTEDKRTSSRPDSAEIMQAFGSRRSQDDSPLSPAAEVESPTISLPEEAEAEAPRTPTSVERKRSESDSSGSVQSVHVDWAELDKTEKQEPESEGQDEVDSSSLE